MFDIGRGIDGVASVDLMVVQESNRRLCKHRIDHCISVELTAGTASNQRLYKHRIGA